MTTAELENGQQAVDNWESTNTNTSSCNGDHEDEAMDTHTGSGNGVQEDEATNTNMDAHNGDQEDAVVKSRLIRLRQWRDVLQHTTTTDYVVTWLATVNEQINKCETKLDQCA